MVVFYTAWEQWIHPGVDCLGTTCRTIFEFRAFRAFLFHQLLDPVSVRDVEPHILAWDTCSVACSLVCLCSVCVSPLVLPFTGSSDISPLPTELLQPKGLVGRNPTELFACDVNRLFVTLAKSVGRNLFLTLALCFSTCCFKRECKPVSVLYRKRITSYPPQTSLVAANREAWTGDWRLLVTCAWQWLHCTGAYRRVMIFSRVIQYCTPLQQSAAWLFVVQTRRVAKPSTSWIGIPSTGLAKNMEALLLAMSWLADSALKLAQGRSSQTSLNKGSNECFTQQ